MKIMDLITDNSLYLYVCIGIFIFVNQNLGIFMLLMGMYHGRSVISSEDEE